MRYQELLTNRLSKCITCFDYADKILTAFWLFLVEQIYLHPLEQRKDC